MATRAEFVLRATVPSSTCSFKHRTGKRIENWVCNGLKTKGMVVIISNEWILRRQRNK